MTGISRYVENLSAGLIATGIQVRQSSPNPFPPWEGLNRRLKRLGLDVKTFFSSFPLHARLEDVDVYHLTSQTLGCLLRLQRFERPVVVTVHDIIPYLLRNDRQRSLFHNPVERLFYYVALRGLRRADALIAVSDFTRQTLIDELDLPAEKIHVIPNAINHQLFRPEEIPFSFLDKYGIETNESYFLYVGSDDPHKNLETLIQAYAVVSGQHGQARLFLVIGLKSLPRRRALESLISRLGLPERVRFFDAVPDQDLPFFYMGAVALIMPSYYEGFGLPALEAMACGTAVVSAQSGSLPEVVKNAGVQFDPQDPLVLADQMLGLLENGNKRKLFAQAGIAVASEFSWQRTALETKEVYQCVT